jgi:alkylated DNA nucleotide flippase Atl1
MDEAYVEAVLAAVEQIPPGKVMAYGHVAEYVGQGGPRQVGAIMSRFGSAVPWWRVVTASGRLPPGSELRALEELTVERTPLKGTGRDIHVDMRRATWDGRPGSG